MLKPKTPRPEWACPFEPTWTGTGWIVGFLTFDGAREGMRVMRDNDDCPQLAVTTEPDGNRWYVWAVV